MYFTQSKEEWEENETSSELKGGMTTKLQSTDLEKRLNCVQEETYKKHNNPDTIGPMQQTHPSDEPDQGTKGSEGLTTRASICS